MNRRAVNDYQARPTVSLGPLFEHAAAEEAAKRDGGIARATSAQPIGWPEYAYGVLVDLARDEPTVHVDQFYARITWFGGHPNAMGGIWTRAIKAGVLVNTGQLRPTRLPGKNAHGCPVYRSLIYGQRGVAA